MRYRLFQPIVAVRKSTDFGRLALPPGSLLTIPLDAPLRGLIEAEWEGEVVRVYVEDVRLRGTLVEAGKSG